MIWKNELEKKHMQDLKDDMQHHLPGLIPLTIQWCEAIEKYYLLPHVEQSAISAELADILYEWEVKASPHDFSVSYDSLKEAIQVFGKLAKKMEALGIL